MGLNFSLFFINIKKKHWPGKKKWGRLRVILSFQRSGPRWNGRFEPLILDFRHSPRPTSSNVYPMNMKNPSTFLEEGNTSISYSHTTFVRLWGRAPWHVSVLRRVLFEFGLMLMRSSPCDTIYTKIISFSIYLNLISVTTFTYKMFMW